MGVTDGYLRAGADVRAAKQRNDGLLFTGFPDSGGGGPAPVYASGTNASATTHASALEAIVQASTHTATGTHSSLESILETAINAVSASHTADGATVEIGLHSSTSTLAATEILVDAGATSSSATHTGFVVTNTIFDTIEGGIIQAGENGGIILWNRGRLVQGLEEGHADASEPGMVRHQGSRTGRVPSARPGIVR